MELKTKIAGIELKNPLMPASGPIVGNFEKMMYIERLGVGCMVTKTISIEEAKVPRPCIYGESNYIMNTETWSEVTPKVWIKEILPNLKKSLEIPLIISAGYKREDMLELIPALDKFADAFEISTHYVGKDLEYLGSIVNTIRKNTNKPIFMKMSPHIPNPIEFSKIVKENGGNGVVAINSLGPTMKVDILRRESLIGNENGYAWTSGPAIKPLALAIVNQIKENVDNFTVIGVGGIKTCEDIVEFLLAGADAVQMLSSALMYGKDLYEKLVNGLPQALEKYGFHSVEEVINTRLLKKDIRLYPKYPDLIEEKCTMCKLCEKVCPYFAVEIKDRVMINQEKCFGCGLCESRCPRQAIGGMYSQLT